MEDSHYIINSFVCGDILFDWCVEINDVLIWIYMLTETTVPSNSCMISHQNVFRKQESYPSFVINIYSLYVIHIWYPAMIMRHCGKRNWPVLWVIIIFKKNSHTVNWLFEYYHFYMMSFPAIASDEKTFIVFSKHLNTFSLNYTK